ncbi:enoyl-CoA hydratase/isomerase family protein [Actinokineospora inagensis]|uniref:enoyl-CoA hydratase/isomerase family protein n=1 Tax=Actinokineospora inagensis TaxID=103730 RepID=UPI00041F5FFA|nr:enoyl-CoA hydratase-related protein [Actinokineospora inagensis]
MTEVLTIEDHDGVRTLTMNRPESFNSLTVELKEALITALDSAASDASVRSVVLTGAGKAFCAGQDLKEHVELLRGGDPEPLATVDKHYNRIVTAITTLPKPIIAAVNGMAAGAGASFAYACDLRIVATTTRFLMAFAGVGLSADSGASWTLPRLIGYGRAMEMLLLAKPVDAEEALRIGLVNLVLPAENVLPAAQGLASTMAAGPTTAYAKIKEALLASAGSSLADGLAVEGRTQREAGGSADHREGVEAFVAKRQPEFVGR